MRGTKGSFSLAGIVNSRGVAVRPTTRAERGSAHDRRVRYARMARLLALKLEAAEFTELFELLDHDTDGRLADEVTKIEEGRRPHVLSPVPAVERRRRTA
jgi:hypothetical protein